MLIKYFSIVKMLYLTSWVFRKSKDITSLRSKVWPWYDLSGFPIVTGANEASFGELLFFD